MAVRRAAVIFDSVQSDASIGLEGPCPLARHIAATTDTDPARLELSPD
jgi:hypothetical protein